MVRQWHNPKIQRKPFMRYNPSLRNKVPKIYRPWFIVVAIFMIFVGIAIIAVTVAMKQFDSDLRDDLFHLWVGIPLVVTGILAFIPFIVTKKHWVILFLVFAIVVMVVCGVAAIVAGLRYWIDQWKQAKDDYHDDLCALDRSSHCRCRNVGVMPATLSDCDDLKHMANLLISEMALDCGGFLACVMGVYLAFMAICCGPWMYVEFYEEQYDPDMRKGPPEDVRLRNAAPAIGKDNRRFSPDR